MERLFGLDAQLIFELCLSALAVFCLFMALSYILFNPVRDMLKKRQQMVAETRDTANKEKEDAGKLKAQYEEKLKNAVIAVKKLNIAPEIIAKEFDIDLEILKKELL